MEFLKVITFLCRASLVQNFISYMLGLPYGRSRSFHQHLPTIFCFDRYQGQFIDTTLETFDEMKPPNEIAKNDYGVRLYFMLRKSKPPVTDFLSTFCVVCPHSMTVERCVSTIGVARIFDWGGPNYQSYAMMSSQIFKKGICGAKIS